MSKNTGTSELINYFDLGANGDVGIAGSLDVNTIANATTDTDKFLVSDTGIIKYRTGAELLTDIGAQGLLTNPVTGTGTTNYVPKFTGSTTIGNSQIIDNGSQVGVGLTPNASYGTFQIKAPAGVYSLDLVGRTAGLNSESQITFWNAAQSSALAYLTNTASNLYIGTGANQPFTLSSGGNFIFGSTTDNGAKFQVSGNAAISSNLTAGGVITSTAGVSMSGGWVRNTLLQSAYPVQVFESNAGGTSRFAAIGYDRTGGMAFWVNSTTIDVTSNNSVLYLANSGAATFSSTINGYYGSITTGQSPASSGTTPNNPMLNLTNNRGVGLFVGGQHASPFGIWLQVSDTSNLGVNYPLLLQPNGGNVGIGTASPSYGLDIASSVAAQAFLRITKTSGAQAFLQSFDDAAYFGTINSFPLVINTNGSERMRITSGGNVGIGLSNPPYRLHVTNSDTLEGTIAIGNSLYPGLIYSSANTGEFRIDNRSSAGGGYISFYPNGQASTLGNEAMRVSTSRNLLIGTTADIGTRVNVNGTTYSTNYISGTQGLNVSGYGFYTQTISGQMTIMGHNVSASSSVANQTNVVNSGWYSSMIKMYYSDGITFHTSSTVYSAGAVYPMGDTERVRIQTDGQVRFQSSIILTNGQINSLTSGGSGQSMYLNFGGNGAIYAGSSYTVLYAGSDERIKTEINHSQSTLTRILNLIPRTFKYKERPDVTNYGFIAQEVEKVMPELVRVSEGITMCLDEEIENQKSVESYGLAWASILVKAIQEQQQQIQELKNKLS